MRQLNLAIILILVIACLVIAALIVILAKRHKRVVKERKRVEKIKSWLEIFETTSDDFKPQLESPPAGSDDYPGVAEAKAKIVKIKAEKAERDAAQEVKEARIMKSYRGKRSRALKEPDIEKRYWRLRNLLRDSSLCWIPGMTSFCDGLRKEISKLVPLRADGLLAKARAGDRFAFLELNDWTNDESSPSGYVLCQFSYPQPFMVPDDWNELVVSFIEYPNWSDFRGIEHYGSYPGQLLALAADALVERSLVKAKIVQAFWDADIERDAIGDAVIRDIAVMVSEMAHEAQNQK